MIINEKDVGLKLSIALLRYNRKISEDEIKALPFVKEEDVPLIIQSIRQNFDVKIQTKVIRTEPFLELKKIMTI